MDVLKQVGPGDMCYEEMLESSEDNGRNSRKTLPDASAGTMRSGFVGLMQMRGVLSFSVVEILHVEYRVFIRLCWLIGACCASGPREELLEISCWGSGKLSCLFLSSPCRIS